jgi:hypothetical protein
MNEVYANEAEIESMVEILDESKLFLRQKKNSTPGDIVSREYGFNSQLSLISLLGTNSVTN